MYSNNFHVFQFLEKLCIFKDAFLVYSKLQWNSLSRIKSETRIYTHPYFFYKPLFLGDFLYLQNFIYAVRNYYSNIHRFTNIAKTFSGGRVVYFFLWQPVILAHHHLCKACRIGTEAL